MAKKRIRLTESDLHRIIKESVKQILKETRLDYDEDNFSGRYNINNNSDYIDDYGYIDNPNEKPYLGGDKKQENEYSWREFDTHGVIPTASGNGKFFRKGTDKYIKKDVNDSLYNRDLHKYWTERDIDRANRLKNRWINGKRSTESLEDANFNISK